MILFQRLKGILSSNLNLFIICSGIWGSTWLVIKYQLDSTDPVASVFYRFLISTVILFVFALLTGRNLKFDRRHHRNFFLQGACNFSINYVITYLAESYAPSATIALIFTLLVAYNIMGMSFFYKKQIRPSVYLGALLGFIGVIGIFWPQISQLSQGGSNIKGIGLGLIATFFASAGNLLAYKNYLRRVPVTAANAWGMFYGTLSTLVIALILNRPLTVSLTSSYWLSLFYLAVFGTVIAFGAYLTLVGRVGAEKAAYTSILSPVIAVVFSLLFEDFHLAVHSGVGITFCLAGVFINLTANEPAALNSEK